MKKLLSCFLFFMVMKCPAQNLAVNPGFEQYTALPSGAAQWSLAVGWSNCGGGGSPDYAHTSGTGLAALPNNYFATVSPHSGDAIMGLILWHTGYLFREYLSTPLTTPLAIGQTYTVSFYFTNGVHNGNYGGYAVDQLGATFSTTPLIQTNTTNINVTPHYIYPGVFQDTSWQLISFQFIADSAYQFITFGNFSDDLVTDTMYYASSSFPAAYYFIDDVSVELSNVQPVAAFFSGNQICPGTCTDFTNLSLNSTSYLWTFAGATPATSTDVNPANICYNTPGSYTVSLIATNAITSDTLTLNNYITVHPYPPPQGIVHSGDTLFANQGSVSYQWYFNGTSINGATGYFYVVSQSGDYNVVCTDANGCEVEAVIFNVIAGFTNATSEGNGVMMFPNPATGILFIRGGYKIHAIEAYNILGEKVPATMFEKTETGLQAELDISELSKGIYWIELSDGKTRLRKQFVKQ